MFHITKDKVEKKRIFELIRVGLYTFCFIGLIVHFNEQENVVFETEKALQRDIALLFFAVILLILQQVKWLNWQSLVVTVAFAPAAVFNVLRFSGSGDLLVPGILEQIALWLELMLITDMVVTKRVRRFKHLNSGLLLFLGAMIVLLFTFRAPGFAVPNAYPLFILLCLIPVNRDEWSRLLSGLLNAGVLCFIQAIIVSQAVNPINFSNGDVGRWYGYFLNIGTFGQYLGVQTVLAVCSLVRTKNRHGRLNPMYFLSILWILCAVVVAVINGVSNYIVGLSFLLLTLFVFGFGKKKANAGKGILLRGLICLLLIVAGAVGLLFLVNYLSTGYDRDKLIQFAMQTPLKYFPAGVEVLAFKLEVVHQFKSILFHGMSITATFIKSPLLMFLNTLGAGRLFIWREYLNHTSFMGNSGGEIVADYFALTAHNEYIQLLYEFGFFAGAVCIIFYIASFIASIVNYVKERSDIFFMPMAFMAMMLGMWTGEMSNIFFVLTFLSTLLIMANIMFLPKKRKVIEVVSGAEDSGNAEEKNTETGNATGKKVKTEEAVDPEAYADLEEKKNAGASGVYKAFVILLSVLIVAGMVFFTVKLVRDTKESGDRAVQYLVLKNETPKNTEDVILVLDGTSETYSYEAIEAALGPRKSTVSMDEIVRVADFSSWADSVFITFELPKEYEIGNRFAVQMTTRCDNENNIPIDVMYYTSRNTFKAKKKLKAYETIFTVDNCEQRVTIRFPVKSEDMPPVIIGNLKLIQYGPEAPEETTEQTAEQTTEQTAVAEQ